MAGLFRLSLSVCPSKGGTRPLVELKNASFHLKIPPSPIVKMNAPKKMRLLNFIVKPES